MAMPLMMQSMSMISEEFLYTTARFMMPMMKVSLLMITLMLKFIILKRIIAAIVLVRIMAAP